MPRLVDRNKQVPGGLVFWEASTKWQPRPWASFNEIVTSLIAHRLGNPANTQKNKLNTDYNSVSDEVDNFNALHCQQMGWNDYIVSGGGQTIPFPQRQNPLASLPAVAAGGKVLVEWLASGEEAIPIEQAEDRAAICSVCPKNGQGDWTRFFTVPVANEIRRQLEKRRGWNLQTSRDAQLGVCEACQCPLPLKVHLPLDRVLKRITSQARAELDPKCWIILEEHLR